jgi:leishmanolysin
VRTEGRQEERDADKFHPPRDPEKVKFEEIVIIRVMLVLLALGACRVDFGQGFCGYHLIADQISYPNVSDLPIPVVHSDSRWSPMRVALDISSFTEEVDEYACRYVGQQIRWSQFSGVCTDADVLDSDRLEVLKQTVSNLERYISRLLKVVPETSLITVSDVWDIRLGSQRQFASDLVVVIAIRPFTRDSKILGQAWPFRYSRRNQRPIVGGMYLNPAYVPNVAQNETSLERFFFTVAVHELMHVLGITEGLMHYWVDKESGRRYEAESLFTGYVSPAYQKEFKILHTPAVRRYVKARFGISEFVAGVPAGVEIEDGGGSGTAGSHPESRVYGGEVMCGIFVGYVWVSNMSLAMLDDTGWYEVNYAMGEPYPWGDGRSMLSAPLATFPNSPPQRAFPRHYLCWEKKWRP